MLIGKLKQTAQGAVLSVSDIRVSEAKRSEDGCPCRSVDNTVPLLYLRRRAPPSKPARRLSTKEPSGALPTQLKKNIKHLTYEATPNSATVNKLCFQPAQAHPRIRYRRIHVL